ncbi:MAG: hypothetical protein AAFO79_12485, partial [Pseudomonadota bacterium]
GKRSGTLVGYLSPNEYVRISRSMRREMITTQGVNARPRPSRQEIKDNSAVGSIMPWLAVLVPLLVLWSIVAAVRNLVRTLVGAAGAVVGAVLGGETRSGRSAAGASAWPNTGASEGIIGADRVAAAAWADDRHAGMGDTRSQSAATDRLDELFQAAAAARVATAPAARDDAASPRYYSQTRAAQPTRARPSAVNAQRKGFGQRTARN